MPQNPYQSDHAQANPANVKPPQKPDELPPTPKLNHVVFWPPFLLLLTAIVTNFVAPAQYQSAIDGLKNIILGNFSWLFIGVAAASLVLCVVICFSPFGRVRLGGDQAKPLMSMWNWFAIDDVHALVLHALFDLLRRIVDVCVRILQHATTVFAGFDIGAIDWR